MQVNKSGVHLDVIPEEQRAIESFKRMGSQSPSPRTEGCDLSEDGNGIASAGGGYVRLLHHMVPEGLSGVCAFLSLLSGCEAGMLTEIQYS